MTAVAYQHAEPTQKVGPIWVTGVILVNLGINVAFFAPIQVLMGLQAAGISPEHKEGILALVTGCGAATSMVANPLFGAFSDRTFGRFGRRVPWVVGGAILGALGLLALAGATSVALMAVAWCLVQAGANAAYAAIFAVIPDRVPVIQRGLVGGLAALGQTVGILIGAVIAAAVSGNLWLGYGLCALALVLSVILYVVRSQDEPLPRSAVPPMNWKEFFAGFVEPLASADFRWAWLTRLLVTTGNHMITLYLLFFLMEEVRIKETVGLEPETGVLVLTGLYAICTIISSVIAGRISDAMGRRKPLVIVSSVIIACAALIIAFVPTWPGGLVGASVLGLGFGSYLAVDFALITQVLPNAAARAKDLGVINIANSLPQVIAPAIAWPFVTFLGGYVALYLAAAVIGLLGAVFVVRIKGVA